MSIMEIEDWELILELLKFDPVFEEIKDIGISAEERETSIQVISKIVDALKRNK
jgi:hypothetical protein